jgi:hypothetical protein
MNTVTAAALSRQPADPSQPDRKARRLWSILTALLLAGFFTEAVFAGWMLSGAGWARRAHSLTAELLIVASLVAGVLSMITLRRVGGGPRLGLILLAVTAVAFLQAAVGVLSAKGANLTWVHVPLGVALVGLAGLAASTARRLGGPDEGPARAGASDDGPLL